MNWMTSAKNRINRSKAKHNDNLRMVANAKLPNQPPHVSGSLRSSKQTSNGSTQTNRNSGDAPISRDSKSDHDPVPHEVNMRISTNERNLASLSAAEIPKERGYVSVLSSWPRNARRIRHNSASGSPRCGSIAGTRNIGKSPCLVFVRPLTLTERCKSNVQPPKLVHDCKERPSDGEYNGAALQAALFIYRFAYCTFAGQDILYFK
jgi:hypothetical protein